MMTKWRFICRLLDLGQYEKTARNEKVQNGCNGKAPNALDYRNFAMKTWLCLSDGTLALES